ncbi:MAG TPA: hypothetical protein ENI62_14265, partial [Gammaproteobacteria bacterium]|nr:hypothetical protein [Gammaproteobacteria bacterium]
AGLLLFTSIQAWMGQDVTLYALPASLLIMVGLGLVWLEIGRPMRSLNVFLNPRTSWMSRESIVALGLLPLGFLSYFTHSLAILAAAAVTAMLFLYCQASILKAAKGIPAWRVREIVPYILSTGLAEGFGLLLLLNSALQPQFEVTRLLLNTALVLLLGRMVFWHRYWRVLSTEAPTRTIKVLNAAYPVFFLIGFLVPTVLIISARLQLTNPIILSLITGFCMILAGWMSKMTIITRAAYNQGYAIPVTPSRGGGKPGPGLTPGWKTRNTTQATLDRNLSENSSITNLPRRNHV